MINNDSLASTIRATAERLTKAQLGWRRHLHQHPELSYQEIETTAFLRARLQEMGLKILPLKMETGLLAELTGAKGGPVVGIRSDIDALPIIERSGVPFASKNPGCMHACGHDVHMATVLGAAAVLSELKEHVPGTVRFIFQPAEEMPPGGARPMIANGALKNMTMLFGLHVDPHLKAGRISVRDGATMASVFDFELIIHGRSGHAARPHLAVDAIVLAAEVIESLQTIVSREIDPIDPIVITFGKIEGGVASNVIAEEVRLAGTARSLSPRTFKRLPAMIRRVVSGICKARGGSFELKAIADYPVLMNHRTANIILTRNFERLFGKGKVDETPQVLGGEDFACYVEKVPGAMFRLGTMNKKLKADKPWHSPEFVVDESAMPVGSALLAATAIDALGGVK